MTEKLKPCPFCGNVAYIVEYISGCNAYHVACRNSKCFMEIGLPIWCKSKTEAIKAWNRRAEKDD